MPQEWNWYTQILICSAIKSKDGEDEILWSKNPSMGSYTGRVGYVSLFIEDVKAEKGMAVTTNMEVERCAWNPKLFLWLALSNKFPTWNFLQKGKIWELVFCMLSQENEENIYHMLVDYHFSKEVQAVLLNIMKGAKK